jgi:trans-aconitate methyltransferase
MTHQDSAATSARYAEVYKAFLDNFESNRDVPLQMILQAIQPDHDLTILSVGAGPGDFDKLLVHALSQTLPVAFSLTYGAIEPNIHFCRQFQSWAEDVRFPNIHFEVVNTIAEDYTIQGEYDCIHYTHSLYYMEGHEERLIVDAMRHLKDTGILSITLDTEEAKFYDLMNYYIEATGTERIGYGSPLEARLLRQMLDRLKLSYQVEYFPEFIDVSTCFEPGSAEGEALMEFLYQTPMAILAEDVKARLLDFMGQASFDRAGRKILSIPAASFILSK